MKPHFVFGKFARFDLDEVPSWYLKWALRTFTDSEQVSDWLREWIVWTLEDRGESASEPSHVQTPPPQTYQSSADIFGMDYKQLLLQSYVDMSVRYDVDDATGELQRAVVKEYYRHLKEMFSIN
jgi:hypothetical protein